MSYSRDRLEEALQVIRTDKQRRDAEEARKIAQTQYREGFHLRKSTAVHGNLAVTLRSNDNSDDEYNPDAKKHKSKRKKKPTTSSRVREDPGDETFQTPSKKQKKTEPSLSDTSDEAVAGATHAFITLKLLTEKGRHFLAEGLRKRQDTHETTLDHEYAQPDNVSSSWRESSGGLHRANRSMVEHSQDFEVVRHSRTIAEQSQSESDKLSKLRNGKVRAHPPRKRKKDSDGVESNVEDTTSETKRQRIDEVVRDPVTPTKKAQPQGDTIDDAISITSTSSTEATIKSPSTPLTPYLASVSPPARIDSHIVTLRTCFAHPINFRSLDSASCSFHSDYRHPIIGHGPVTGQYLVSARQPSQLIELEGGHRNRNKDLLSDTMCIACALSYLQIIRCPRHTFARLPYNSILTDGGPCYVNDMFTDIKRGDPNRNNKSIAETCHLCPTPAAWKCCSPQSTDKIRRPCRLPGETIEAAVSRNNRCSSHASSSTSASASHQVSGSQIQPPLHGCGLTLCMNCHALVQNRCNGYMQAHRAMILREVRMKQLGARADIEFLFREGLVWKAYYVDKEEK